MKTTYKDFTVNIRKIDEGGMEADFYLPKDGRKMELMTLKMPYVKQVKKALTIVQSIIDKIYYDD